MKTLLWTSAVLALIALCSLGVNNYLGRTSEELSTKIVEVQALVQAERWGAAQQNFDRLVERWGEQSPVWAAIIRHQEIDELEIAFARIKQFLASEERALALAELEMAKLLLLHVPEKEKVRLHNIL